MKTVLPKACLVAVAAATFAGLRVWRYFHPELSAGELVVKAGVAAVLLALAITLIVLDRKSPDGNGR